MQKKYCQLLIVIASLFVIKGTIAQYPLSVTDIDGNVYSTVRIGNQIWMKENLRTTRYLNGDPIQHMSSNEKWKTTKEGARSAYNNDSLLGKQLGFLYNYHAVYNWRGICPWGWHIPSVYEWEQLIQYLDGASGAGAKLKAVEKWNLKHQPAIGAVPFAALPAGFRNAMGFFDNMGSNASFWSASIREDNVAWFFIINQNDPRLIKVSGSTNYGMSCRCIKD
ncbi:MAG: fibrobacter succinogenes major paralogous domain-containing protein [Candidatus Competibacteraceae bacterium]|nr:fibrobacter succinogenes major paralogous domain-containing protein [Candidatus Competibacteraceae bacterium]